MIWHWLTTGWRSLVANPLFSLITIASLSIGCCGALLAGANIKQHLSFERWVPDSERIFLITRKSIPQTAPAGMTIRVDGPSAGRPQTISPLPMRNAIEGQVPDLEEQARMFRGQSLLPPDPSLPQGPPVPGEPPRTLPPGSVYVDPGFFRMFGLEFVEGSAEGLKEPDQIVITQTAAKRLFGETSALGQSVENDQKKTFRIAGVIRDLPPETYLRFEAIAGIKTLEAIVAADEARMKKQQEEQRGQSGGMIFITTSQSDWRGGFGGGHFIKMAAGADPELFKQAAERTMQTAAEEGVKRSAQTFTGPNGQIIPLGMPNYKYALVPLLDVHLGGPELTGIQSNGDITMLATLAGAAIALLAVSAFNYVTLSLARSLRRRPEVAVRKVLGADQGALVRHYLTESGLVTAISLVLGFALAQLLHPWFARAIGQPETLFNLFDPTFAAGSLIFSALLAIAVGAYPAFYLASVRPRTALGEGGAASPGRISQLVTTGLMGLQIAAATGLLIVATSMAAQANYIENRPLGFTVKDRYQIQANCPLDQQLGPVEMGNMLRRCQAGSRQIISRTPGLSNVAYFGGQLISENIQLQAFGRTATSEKLGELARISVDTDFLQTMGATLLAGRFFDSKSGYDRALIDMQAAMQAATQANQGRPPGFGPGSPPPRPPPKVPVVITRAMLPMLGADTPDAAVGQQFSMQPNSPYVFDVVGVVEDWNQRPLKFAVHPIVFVPQNANQAIAEIPEDQVANIQASMNLAWKEIATSKNASITLNPLRTLLQRTYEADFRLMRAVTAFAIVAIIVACMGVFGLSAFEMRRRVREIGIRKALGASPANVAIMVISRATLFAAIATVVAWPIAFWMANEWLTAFVYRTLLGPYLLPVASLMIIAFVALAVTLNALRAAALRPGLTLRAA